MIMEYNWTLGGGMTLGLKCWFWFCLSPNWCCWEPGFGKQCEDWQANAVSWTSHYITSPHTHTRTHRCTHIAAPSPGEILQIHVMCEDAQEKKKKKKNHIFLPPNLQLFKWARSTALIIDSLCKNKQHNHNEGTPTQTITRHPKAHTYAHTRIAVSYHRNIVKRLSCSAGRRERSSPIQWTRPGGSRNYSFSWRTLHQRQAGGRACCLLTPGPLRRASLIVSLLYLGES